ncbi:MAG: substrate-binding domain-containing protein [Clostridiales Family XIII bacterium]|jgi:ribose transport system substrate-binding protein|nr:substrate-binding domain-containing protein [Clostridiales Family XIII bacterium]
MKKRNLITLLAACALILGLLSGCGGSGQGTDTGSDNGASNGSAVSLGDMKIGLSMQTMGAPYFVSQSNAFQAACASEGIEVIAVDANGDMTKQQSDIEDLVVQGCNVIVINPADAQGAVAVANSVMAQGIPVFIMDNSIDPSATYVSMIQSNNAAIGTLVGEWIASEFGSSEIRIGLLSGNEGNLLGLDRRSGVIKGIVETQLVSSNSTNFKVVTQGWGGWNQEDGLTAAESMLTAAPDLNVIVAENDSMGLGAAIALQNAGRDDVIVCGIDGQKEALALVQSGEYGASGLNDPVGVANLTLATIIRYANGDTNIPKLINTEPAVITSANINQYYDPNSDF